MVYQIQFKQTLPIPLGKAWEFLSSPENLKTITPPHMGFNITSRPEGKMYPGMIISYMVSPIPGVPMTWVSEITHVREPYFFVDEQREGPYEIWHHQHLLEEIPGGVEMTDIIHYKVPGWFLGRILNALFIRRQLQGIFDFRKKKLEELFGKYEKSDFATLFRNDRVILN